MFDFSFKKTALAALALAAAAMATPALAAGSLTGYGSVAKASTVDPSAITQVVFDVSGITSNGFYGDPENQVFFLNVGANAEIVSVTWNATINSPSPSWLSEALVDFTDSGETAGVSLGIGFGEDFSGTGTYSGSGVLADFGLSFNVGADGLLRLEFHEDFDDVAGADATWTSGTLVFGVSAVPEPGTYAMMAAGLLAIGAVARRRRRED